MVSQRQLVLDSAASAAEARERALGLEALQDEADRRRHDAALPEWGVGAFTATAAERRAPRPVGMDRKSAPPHLIDNSSSTCCGGSTNRPPPAADASTIGRAQHTQALSSANEARREAAAARAEAEARLAEAESRSATREGSAATAMDKKGAARMVAEAPPTSPLAADWATEQQGASGRADAPPSPAVLTRHGHSRSSHQSSREHVATSPFFAASSPGMRSPRTMPSERQYHHPQQLQAQALALHRGHPQMPSAFVSNGCHSSPSHPPSHPPNSRCGAALSATGRPASAAHGSPLTAHSSVASYTSPLRCRAGGYELELSTEADPKEVIGAWTGAEQSEQRSPPSRSPWLVLKVATPP